VDTSELNFPNHAEVRGKELEMAMSLIESLSADWKPDKYTDEYRENLMKVIHAKVKGRKPKLTEEERPQDAEVIDLMERLQRSLAASKAGARKTAGAKTRTKKKPRAA
jgi:DNA end-binding protein Ku